MPPPLLKPERTLTGQTPGNGQENLAWAMPPEGWREGSSHLLLDDPLHTLKPFGTFVHSPTGQWAAVEEFAQCQTLLC